MPFKSDKQRKFLEAKKPDVAKKFEQHEKKPKKKPSYMNIRKENDDYGGSYG